MPSTQQHPQAAQGEDVQAIRSTTEALGQAIQKIGASVYETPAGAGAGPAEGENTGGPASGNPEGEVIDAEFEDVK